MITLNNSWSGETLEDVRKFLQNTLSDSVKNITFTTAGGKVNVRITKNNGALIDQEFTAADDAESEGYKASLRLSMSQTVFGTGVDVPFTYNYRGTIDGEDDYTVEPSLTFEVYRVVNNSKQGDPIYTINDKNPGVHTLIIPAAVFDGLTGTFRIEGTYSAMYNDFEFKNTTPATKQFSINECSLEFLQSFSLATQIQGYTETQSLRDVNIMYKGSSTGQLQIYIDGILRATQDIYSGTLSTVVYSMSATDDYGYPILDNGRHTMQLVVKMDTGMTNDESGERIYIYSNSLLFDFYKGQIGDHVGIQAVFQSPDIIKDPINNVTIQTEQYVYNSIKYAGCKKASGIFEDPYEIAIVKNGLQISSLEVSPEEVGEYTFRDTESGTYTLTFQVTTTSRKINIQVSGNSAGIGVASGALFNIITEGRNNREQPSKINKIPFTDKTGKSYEGVLENFQFNKDDKFVDGWDGQSLIFKGNTTLTIPYNPFTSFSTNAGMYLEFTFYVDTVLDSDVNIVECLDSNGVGGFYLKSEEAGITTKISKLNVSTPFKSGEWYTVGFMVKTYTGSSWTNTDGSKADYTSTKTTLLELYVNGIRTAVAIMADSDSFDTGAIIKMNGLGAVWRLNSIRAYNNSLNSFEIFNNWLTNLTDAKEILDKSAVNDVLNNNKTDLSSQKLINLGKNVMIIDLAASASEMAYIDSDGLAKLETTGSPIESRPINNRAAFLDPQAKKKQNYIVKGITYYHNGSLNNAYSFKVGPTLMQCQGTSSTYYSRKNYDIFFTGQKFLKGESKQNWVSDFSDDIGSESHMYDGNDRTKPRYSMGPNDKAVPVVCMKADYVDSSNLHNVVLTTMTNDVWKTLGENYMTPPQHNHDTYYDDVRVGINGHPVDVFINDGEELYIGQYNMCNEKKDSHEVFGFVKGSGNASVGDAICLEFLENNKPATLFKASSDEGFDWNTCASSQDEDGNGIPELEFRYPANDWKDGDQLDKNLVKDLFEWVYSCWKQWKNTYNETSGTYRDTKFAEEVTQHFNVYNLCAWYLYTEYFLAVDQRSKNMMLATWDRKIWYFLPYDSDTALGVTNDGYLKNPWNADENTMDEKGQYCYMGHDSALWDLVRYFLFDGSFAASYGDDPENPKMNLSAIAARLREENESNTLYNMANVRRCFDTNREYWSEMAYNFDEETKYIAPLTKQSAQGSKTEFAQFVQGARDAHRNWLLDKRFRMLDAKYGCGYYLQDSISPKLAIDDKTIRATFTVVPLYETVIRCQKNAKDISKVTCKEGKETEITITDQTFGDNDPFAMIGLSGIKELDLGSLAQYISKDFALNAQGLDVSRMQKFIMVAPNNSGKYADNSGLSSIISGMIGVKQLSISGFPNVTGILNLSNNLLLREVEIDCPNLSTVILPSSFININSFNLGHLNQDVPWEFWDEFNKNYYRKTGGSIVVCEFTTDAPNYGFRASGEIQTSKYIMANKRYDVVYLSTPSIICVEITGGNVFTHGAFGSSNSTGDSYRNPAHIKKIHYAKFDSNLYTSSNRGWCLLRLFQNCTNLEYVNTKGWDIGHSETTINNGIDNLIPPNIKEFDLSFFNPDAGGFTSTASTFNFSSFYGPCNNLEYLKFSRAFFNVIINKSYYRIGVPQSASLNAKFFEDLVETLPDIHEMENDIDVISRTINFGATNFNASEKFPQSLKNKMSDKGWVAAL